jgi:hypothetical protein
MAATPATDNAALLARPAPAGISDEMMTLRGRRGFHLVLRYVAQDAAKRAHEPGGTDQALSDRQSAVNAPRLLILKSAASSAMRQV